MVMGEIDTCINQATPCTLNNGKDGNGISHVSLREGPQTGSSFSFSVFRTVTDNDYFNSIPLSEKRTRPSCILYKTRLKDKNNINLEKQSFSLRFV